MTAALARKSVVDRPARVPVQPRIEERWSVRRGPERAPKVMLMVIVASLAIHGIVVSTLVVSGRIAPPPPPHAIAVEIVQDVPPPVRKVAKADAPKPAPPPAPVVAKAEPPKPPAPKPEPAKPEPPKAVPQKPVAQKPAATPEQTQLEALQKELAALKAEHNALASSAPAPGKGAMAGSLQALALPGLGEGTGEVVSYQEIVFSQLAKAKDIGRKPGKPGTSGVRFEIDAAGRLVSADIVSPSGIAALDSEALDIVRKAAPFPPPPEGAQREFVANVNFVPQEGAP